MTFLAALEILPYNRPAAEKYGALRAYLEKTGQAIGALDLLIAAHALAGGFILVTNNEREFQRIPGIVMENWVKDEV